MDPLAKKALATLLRLADRHSAGVAARAPALTAMHLKDYHQLRSLQNKEGFEAVLKYAQDSGAVRLNLPALHPDGYIQRVELVDVEALARLLGQGSLTSRLATAQGVLQGRVSGFPVLRDVLDQWASIKRVRNTSPDDAGDWLDACVAVESCRSAISVGQLETAVRDASARVFRNSKRIEALIAPIDVLLSGSVEESARSEAEVLQELGLNTSQQHKE